ncbi:MAG: hypothetical protein HY248_00195, partial [Fimbriimonas ginsengisoli]|nr:hypothetical protein [Fimbriimonas ginsengisoli]
MNRYVLGAALMSAIGISALAPAQYQSNKLNSTPSGVTFRGGVVFPIDSTLRDIDTTFFGVGLEYLFASSYLHTGETFLSFDWIGRSSTGERANLYPV